MRIVDTGPENFDNDRAASEVEDLEPDELQEHPLIAYRQGTTRFDLDAPGRVYDGDGEVEELTAREYLKTESPTTFECRRLNVSEIATCLQRGDEVGACWAFALSCKSIENASGLSFTVQRKKLATDGQMSAVQDRLGYDVIARVGKMIINGSRQPTRQEGKPSGT